MGIIFENLGPLIVQFPGPRGGGLMNQRVMLVHLLSEGKAHLDLRNSVILFFLYLLLLLSAVC